jgi:hypothetical protein
MVKNQKQKYSGQQQKETDYDEPHLAPNEKTQPIQWTKRSTGALMAAGSLWPLGRGAYRAQRIRTFLRKPYCHFFF